MADHMKTRRNAERDSIKHDENMTGPTTRAEMLHEPMAFGDTLGSTAQHTVGGGHEAQDLASRDQEQGAFNLRGGHARLHKADEQPLWDRKPGKPANAR